jgi:hypothetical protein
LIGEKLLGLPFIGDVDSSRSTWETKINQLVFHEMGYGYGISLVPQVIIQVIAYRFNGKTECFGVTKKWEMSARCAMAAWDAGD